MEPKIGALWKALPLEDRKVYEERYAKELKAYGTAMEAYKQTDAAYREHRQDEPSQKADARKRTNAATGYQLFTAETYPADDDNSSRMRQVGLAWKQLTEQERWQYTDRAFLLSQKKTLPAKAESQ
ncbi:hypothetical protein ACIQVR_04820 [Streptomyces xanthochromogenes]|uniref:hypothetical protein n=2 Tax=Streptomyces xanthochromogenes TaxID=67384 RepID=UPI0037F76DAA